MHEPLLWQQSILNYKLFVKKIPIWMHTPPDFDVCDGLCTIKPMSRLIARLMEYRKTAFKYVHKPLLWQQNTLNYSLFTKQSSFGCTLLLISMFVTACARTINVTSHSTLDGVPENSVQVRAQAVAMATNTLICHSFVKEISISIHTPPDFDPWDAQFLFLQL